MNVINLQPYRDKARRKEAERISRALHAAVADCLLQLRRKAERRVKTSAPETTAQGVKGAPQCKGFDDNAAE